MSWPLWLFYTNSFIINEYNAKTFIPTLFLIPRLDPILWPLQPPNLIEVPVCQSELRRMDSPVRPFYICYLSSNVALIMAQLEKYLKIASSNATKTTQRYKARLSSPTLIWALAFFPSVPHRAQLMLWVPSWRLLSAYYWINESYS